MARSPFPGRGPEKANGHALRTIISPMLTLARHLMGTRFELALPAVPGGMDEAQRRAAGEEALDEIERLDHQLSMYRPDSAISRLNAGAAADWVAVEPRLYRLLERMGRLADATGGAFDPTVGPLLRAWGFRGARGRWADESEVEAARRLTGMRNVAFDADAMAIRFTQPGVALDVGAVGKGYAVEAAMDVLRELGVRSALLHGGTSTVAALGEQPTGEPWGVALADPANPGCSVATVALRDGGSLSVSAVHGKAFSGPDGRAYGHVLDPRAGRPVAGARLAAVVMDRPTEADALSTALLVLGREGLNVLSAGWPDSGGLIVDEHGSLMRGGTLRETPGDPEG